MQLTQKRRDRQAHCRSEHAPGAVPAASTTGDSTSGEGHQLLQGHAWARVSSRHDVTSNATTKTGSQLSKTASMRVSIVTCFDTLVC